VTAAIAGAVSEARGAAVERGTGKIATAINQRRAGNAQRFAAAAIEENPPECSAWRRAQTAATIPSDRAD